MSENNVYTAETTKELNKYFDQLRKIVIKHHNKWAKEASTFTRLSKDVIRWQGNKINEYLQQMETIFKTGTPQEILGYYDWFFYYNYGTYALYSIIILEKGEIVGNYAKFQNDSLLLKVLTELGSGHLMLPRML